MQRLAARGGERALAGGDRRIERPAGTAGEHDQTRRLLGKPRKFQVRPLGLRGFEVGARGEPQQAAIALLAGGQQNDARKTIPRRRAAVVLIAEIDAERAADDRLNAGARHFFGEFERAEHVVGVGERQRRLPVLLGELRQPRDRQRALEQRIGRMHVQMHEPRLFRRGFGRGGFCSRHRQSVTRACGCSRRGIFFGRGSREHGHPRFPAATRMRDARPRCPWRAGACRSRRPFIHVFSAPLGQPCTPPRGPPPRAPRRPNSNDAKHLRPHGDHAEKQSDRRQCQSLLGDSANHCSAPSLERIGNIVHILFAESRMGSGSEMAQFLQLPQARATSPFATSTTKMRLGKIAGGLPDFAGVTATRRLAWRWHLSSPQPHPW